MNIKEVSLDNKGVRPNTIGKSRLELNFLQKLWNIWSLEHLIEILIKVTT